MNPLAIITGAGDGIGRATALQARHLIVFNNRLVTVVGPYAGKITVIAHAYVADDIAGNMRARRRAMDHDPVPRDIFDQIIGEHHVLDRPCTGGAKAFDPDIADVAANDAHIADVAPENDAAG